MGWSHSVYVGEIFHEFMLQRGVKLKRPDAIVPGSSLKSVNTGTGLHRLIFVVGKKFRAGA